MKLIIYLTFIKNIFPTTYTKNIALGRWSLVYTQDVIHKRIDWANEDHCGCCDYNK